MDVTGRGAVGGLVGYNNGGTITASYATGAVSGTNQVGGLAGWNEALGTITASYATGAVSGTNQVGGLAGYNDGGTITASYFDTNTSLLTAATGNNMDSGASGKTTRELQEPTEATGIYSTWAAGTWHFGADNQYPALVVDFDSNRLIDIGTLAQLHAVRWDLNGDGAVDDASDPTVEGTDAALYAAAFPNPATGMGCPDTCRGYELKASLDFDPDGDGHQDGDAYWNSGAGWLPIDDSTTGFSGVFNGNGHTISNLFINRETTDFIGLFARLEPGGIIRVGVVDADVTGGSFVGSLVGRNIGTITGSYATGAVNGFNAVGGLVGRNVGTTAGSYATGAVSGIEGVGGLAGQNIGTITASYATGAVSGIFGVGGTDGVGGLVGSNYESATITASYATGTVSSIYGAGGLVGTNFEGTITASYFDTYTSGLTAATGNNMDSGASGQTTGELQEPTEATGIYSTWAAGTWHFGADNQYPALVVDFDGDADTPATWQEFGYQLREGPEELAHKINNGQVR